MPQMHIRNLVILQTHVHKYYSTYYTFVGLLLLEEAFQKFSILFKLIDVTLLSDLAITYIVLLVQNDCGF